MLFKTRRLIKEIRWGQVFDFAIRDSEWFKKQSLNPGRWAMGFPALYLLYRVLSETRPKSILEFGLGESTKLTSQYCRHFSDACITVIEQNEQWKNIFCASHNEVKEFMNILPLSIIRRSGHRHYSYSGLLPCIAGKKYDLIMIDGPWGSRHNSRDQILEIVEEGLLADDFIIIMDDSERPGEKETLKKLRALLKSKNIVFSTKRYSGEKDTTVICSAKFGFLASL